MIEDFAKLIPKSMRRKSGMVFYSGRRAFQGRAPLYVLGLNPGGDPHHHQRDETVEWHTREVLRRYPDEWSAYVDESWGGADPGNSVMQRRVRHLLEALSLSPGRVPASNLLFVRSSKESDLGGELRGLAEQCWRFHKQVIKVLKPPVILCFGKTCGAFVREMIKSDTLREDSLQGEVIETNNRGWRSQWFSNGKAPSVVIATHPGWANWKNPNADPSGLVRKALGLK